MSDFNTALTPGANLTQAQAEAKCSEWQKILRLQEWDIRVSVVSLSQLDKFDRRGEIEWRLEERMAKIQLLRSEDYHWEDIIPDMERSLIHELLHLLFVEWKYPAGDHQEIAEEQAINVLSTALLKLYRRIPASLVEDRQQEQSIQYHIGTDGRGP